ncbi:hypothetical protein EON65_11165 [archaeon]|nr:MAG: hypothetical protein EON65_11165 [archaeon]
MNVAPKQINSSPHPFNPAHPPSTPQRKYSISSDSDDGDHPSSHSNPAITTPSKKSPLKDDYNSYAEPLEVFDAYDVTWYVYLTDQGDVYYLDSVNSHSQWEDPREHGVIAYAQEGYEENASYPSPGKGVSPGKMSDYAPPLSPALKTNSLHDIDGDAEAAQNDGVKRALPVRSLFGDEEDTTIDNNSHLTSEHTPSRSLLNFKDSAGGSLLSASPEAYSLPYEPISQSHVQNVKQSLQKASEPSGDVDSKAKQPAKDSALFTKINQLPQSQPPNHSVAPASEDMRLLCEEYVCMLRQGKSLQDIRNNLEQTGYGNIAIAKIMSTLDDCLMMEDVEDGEGAGAVVGGNQGNSSAGINKEEKQPESQMNAADRMKMRLKELQEAHPVVIKYVKMVQMGVLPMSVISKMKLDSIDAHFIDLMEDALGLHDEQHSKAKGKSLDSWLPQERLKNSIWAFDTTEQTLLADQELAELESMFRTQRESRSRNVDAAKPSKLNLQVLEGKRAQNISIGLVTFRSVGSHVDILKAICALNGMDGNLHVDNLENLKTLLPTESELKLLHRLNHPTHPSETFFQVVLLFYPELPFRLNTFITCLAFTDYTVSIEKKLRMIMNAINQILSSTRLAKVLQKLLVAGRVMMQPGGKGNKIVSADPKTSVLEQLLQVSIMKSKFALL